MITFSNPIFQVSAISQNTTVVIFLQPDGVCKVTPSRIFSMAVHPMTSTLLVAAGDKWGAVGLWNVEDTTSEQHGVQVFYVSCLLYYHSGSCLK